MRNRFLRAKVPGTAPVPITRIPQIGQPTQLSHICRESSIPDPLILGSGSVSSQDPEKPHLWVFLQGSWHPCWEKSVLQPIMLGRLGPMFVVFFGCTWLKYPNKRPGQGEWCSLGLWRAHWQQQQGDLPDTSPVDLGNKRILVLYCVLLCSAPV